MKILMFSSDPRLREEARLDSRQARQGSEVSKRIEKYRERLEKLDIILLDRSRGRFLRFFKGYFEARRLLKREKYDVMTAQEPEHWFLAWLLSRKFTIPWQMQIHTDIFSPHYVHHSVMHKGRVWLAKFLIPRASCVRAVSERIKKSINRPDAVVLPIFSARKGGRGVNLREKYPGYDFYILMVSRLTKEKNIQLALSAVHELSKKYPKILLVIVGGGLLARYIESDENIKLEGWQSELDGYYRSADCFLLTSNYEGYGMAAVEALQYGLPVVMTDVGVAGEIVKNGVNGLVVPAGDKELLVVALERLYEDRELRGRLSQAAKNLKIQTEEEYLKLYVESLKSCAQR
ncbi:MAG: glycosyltransferase family 4 protein [bacterium]|nr:glycosyltransferase family 4 protein [bacterium]